jgi:hypothetical protein
MNKNHFILKSFHYSHDILGGFLQVVPNTLDNINSNVGVCTLDNLHPFAKGLVLFRIVAILQASAKNESYTSLLVVIYSHSFIRTTTIPYIISNISSGIVLNNKWRNVNSKSRAESIGKKPNFFQKRLQDNTLSSLGISYKNCLVSLNHS